jgi:hypothetical protein
MRHREPKRPNRVAVSLSRDELRQLRRVRKYVAGWDSQRNSFAEAMRYLIRGWSREESP